MTVTCQFLVYKLREKKLVVIVDEFILLLEEVCHVTNCDNSEHAFVNKGDSRYFVCSSWNICILVDSFFIVCPWIILNILLECYSSTRWRTGIYSWRQGSRFVFC